MADSERDIDSVKYLRLLSRSYPTIQAVSTEIINLRAILNLPKGTEHYISDIHGEYEGFSHILRNASGSVRRKIDQALGDYVSATDRDSLATLIYYPKLKLSELKKTGTPDRDWYTITLKRLISVCKLTTSKYTRSKMRKMLPKDFEYIINELMSAGGNDFNKEEYYNQIVSSIIDIDRGDDFIIALCDLARNSVIDKLHIIGDIFDRGDSPHLVMDELMRQRYVDIQWGNHDILWMGAAAGNKCCIANAVRICLRYNNYDFLEDGYGINMRPLAMYAAETYGDDPCDCFVPKHNKADDYADQNDAFIAKMHKAISIIQFKLEGQYILSHPECGMHDRLLLDKLDLAKGLLRIDGVDYPLLDTRFPTLSPDEPYSLTAGEQMVIEGLLSSFLSCEKLQQHIDFLYEKGGMYKHYNNALMFHGCIPMDKDGSFSTVTVNGEPCSGKKLFDRCELMARQGRYAHDSSPDRAAGRDFMWYLWCGSGSPLFGKDKMATFERYFTADKALHREKSDAYFTLAYTPEMVDRVLDEFGIEQRDTVIINGHIPVKIKKGESPIKADGRLLIIDGGISRAYQPVTGIAGYTLVSNSHEMYLSEHEAFSSVSDSVCNNTDLRSRYVLVRSYPNRLKIADTDDGQEIARQIADLERLLAAYRSGKIKQRKD